jgi:hypothetical protein
VLSCGFFVALCLLKAQRVWEKAPHGPGFEKGQDREQAVHAGNEQGS